MAASKLAMSEPAAPPLTLPSARAEALLRSSARVAWWLKRYGKTRDERKGGVEEPFDPFPRQVEFLSWLEELERKAEPGDGRGDGLVEKCRDAGVTVLCCAFALHRWLFRPGSAIGFGSRKLELVDNKADPKSIFEKIRFLLYHLPPWQMPAGFKRDRHDLEARLINPANGATITGEGGDNVGRGGRFSAYFVDEKAFMPNADSVDRALSQATRFQVDISTPNGAGNNFWRKRFSGRCSVFVFDWKDDFRKNRTEVSPDGRTIYPWYEAQKAAFDPITVAQEIDRDYTASVEGICIPAAWVRAAVGLRLDGFANTPMQAGLDVAEEGTNKSVLIGRRGPVVCEVASWAKCNTTQTAWRVRDYGEAWGVVGLAFDHPGVGSGPRGNWESAEGADAPKFATRPVNTGSPPTDDLWPDGRKSREKFLNLKAELWWKLRCRFERAYEFAELGVRHPPEDMISLPNHPELIADLSMVLTEHTATGKIAIESKKKMRSRGVKSTDFADALVLAFCDAGGSVYETRGVLVLGAGEVPQRRLVPSFSGLLWVNPERDDWLED